MAYLEDVFVTEGVPEFTFVRPPNYTALLVDLRRQGEDTLALANMSRLHARTGAVDGPLAPGAEAPARAGGAGLR